MNDELPGKSPTPKKSQSLDERFADKPHTRQRLLEIADMVDKLIAEGCTADEAEARAIEEIRKLGNGLLTDWAETTERAAVAKARAKNPKLQSYRKKSPDVAFDLRGCERAGAAPARRTPRTSTAPVPATSEDPA